MASEHSGGEPREGLPFAGGEACLLCPLCLVLQRLTEARPEVAGHLLQAARELSLAVRALAAAHAEACAQAGAAPDEGLERIDIE